MIHPFAQFVLAVAAIFAHAPAATAQQSAAVVAVRQHTAFRHVGSGIVHVARPAQAARVVPSRVLPQLRLRR